MEQAKLFLDVLDSEYSLPYKNRKRTQGDGKVIHVKPYVVKKKIPLQFKLLYNIAIFGGLRRGELLGLKWDNVDFANDTISIVQTVQRVDRTTVVTDPKTRTSARTISLPFDVMQLLKRYKKQQAEYRLSMGDKWQGDDWIFIQTNGTVMNVATPYHKLHEIINRYNETVEDETKKLPLIKLHGTRHTHATLLISTDVDLPTISKRLGHSKTSTTLDIYAHSFQELDRKASDAMEDILYSKPV